MLACNEVRIGYGQICMCERFLAANYMLRQAPRLCRKERHLP